VTDDCRYSPDIMAGGTDCRLCGYAYEEHASKMPQKEPAVKKSTISPKMLAAMRNIAAGRASNHGLFGMSAHGGHEGTIQALQRRGFIEGRDRLTAEGRAALEESEAKQ